MKVGVAKETAPGERRVALVPEVLGKLKAAGLDILVERGAGAGSSIPDAAYQDAGATVVSTDDLYRDADAILRVAKPSDGEVKKLRAGQALLGLLSPLIDPKTAKSLAERGVTAISLDAIPRTLSRAQSMDALSSQANVGGYKAVLIAANAYGRYFPLLTTAAGTAKPANVLILGIGVAGLQAIGTARRLGAVVETYDVRPETRSRPSLGAQFVKLKTTIDATSAGGCMRADTQERASQQAELNEVIGGMDIVITTAQGTPPPLVTGEAVGLIAGLTIVDGASDLGGNVELSKAGKTTNAKRDRHRPGQPAGLDGGRRVGVLRPQHRRSCSRWSRTERSTSTSRTRSQGDRHHQGRRGRLEAVKLPSRPRRPLEDPRATTPHPLAIFTLAILVGFEVISKVRRPSIRR
jgi:NAD(P) transhydrogenase subunit alpha